MAARERVLFGAFSGRGGAIHADVELCGATETSVRLQPGLAVVSDSAGRLLAFDLATGRCVRDLRL